jgi:hypothetical protein
MRRQASGDYEASKAIYQSAEDALALLFDLRAEP